MGAFTTVPNVPCPTSHLLLTLFPGRTSVSRQPWTADDDQKLRVLVQRHTIGLETPWQTIALKGNFGHNSGSCQKRFAELPKLQYQNMNVFVFANGTLTAEKQEF